MTARHSGLACLFAASLLACPGALPPAQAAPVKTILLTLKGRTQGAIKGGATMKGFESAIAISEFDHATISPRDATSGLPTGRIQSQGIRIRKPIDATSPRLLQAFASNEMLTEATLTFFQANAQGASVPYLRIRYSNGSIASIDQRMLNTENPQLARYPEYEEIVFYFDQEIQELPGGTPGTGGTMRRPPKLP